MSTVTIETIHTALIEEIPTRYVTARSRDGHEYPEQAVDVDALGLPEPFASAVQRVAEAVDEATCDAPDCTQPIGWVLHEDDEHPSGGGLAFRMFAVVVLPESAGSVRPATVCEDCDPALFYAVAAQ